MKIGLIVPGFSADEKDWCIPALLDLARSLAVKNEVYVLALRYPHRRRSYRIERIRVQSLNGRERGGPASVLLWLQALAAIIHEHRAGKFDVLHAVYGGEAGLVAVFAGRLLHVPSIVSLVGGELAALSHIHYGADLNPRQRWMNRQILLHATRIFGASETMTERAAARLTPARRRFAQTLPLGVDTELFSPPEVSSVQDRSPESAEINLLNVGSLIPVKDQATLLAAAALLSQDLPAIRVNIVGTGELEDGLQTLVGALGISERVRFAGAVRHEELPEWYRHADLYVQSSLHEGEGMAVLEAAACGTPVAGTAVGVLADLAKRQAAIPVPTGDPAALAQGIRRALEERALLAARGRQAVCRDYSLEVITSKLNEVYGSL